MIIVSSMTERTAMADRDRELQRQGVPPAVAGRRTAVFACGCTYAAGNTVTPRQAASGATAHPGRLHRGSVRTAATRAATTADVSTLA
jgi:hypothetical protein